MIGSRGVGVTIKGYPEGGLCGTQEGLYLDCGTSHADLHMIK